MHSWPFWELLLLLRYDLRLSSRYIETYDHFLAKLLIVFQGPLNTYARAGKLFPVSLSVSLSPCLLSVSSSIAFLKGPHLYAGAGLVFLWALAYACVPAMQRGNDTARTVHIGANLVGIGMFAWQVQSGIPILLKVIEKTSWP